MPKLIAGKLAQRDLLLRPNSHNSPEDYNNCRLHHRIGRWARPRHGQRELMSSAAAQT